MLAVLSVSLSVMSDFLWPHGLELSRLLCPWGFSRQEYWSGLPCPPPGDLPNPGIEPMPSCRGIFQTQGLNPGLLHCRWILYQLSYQRSPYSSYIWQKKKKKKRQQNGPSWWFSELLRCVADSSLAVSSKLELPWSSWVLTSVSSIEETTVLWLDCPFLHCCLEIISKRNAEAIIEIICFPSFRENSPALLLICFLKTAALYFVQFSCFW